MDFHFENVAILLALGAIVAPILLHFLQRRQVETIDWGAMQFLPDGIVASRRRQFDELLLLLLRIGLIAMVVFALATPVLTGSWIASQGNGPDRESVIIIDGSYSMGLQIPDQQSPWQDALQWLRDHADFMPAVGRGKVILARRPAFELGDNPLDELRAMKPIGNPDLPDALAMAWLHLQKNRASSKEIVVLTDLQRHGWADSATLASFEKLEGQWQSDIERLRKEGLAIPTLRVVGVGPELAPMQPSVLVSPLKSSRAVARSGQAVAFKTTLKLAHLPKSATPKALTVLVDGTRIADLPVPAGVATAQGNLPLSFQHRFVDEGRHVVTITAEAERQYDWLDADNTQNVIVEVQKDVPVLLVDGDRALGEKSSTYFLKRALSTQHVVSFAALTPELLAAEKFAVVVLADVPALDQVQADALERFVAGGGGVLIFAGERAGAARGFYNDVVYRDGDGWLPVKLGNITESSDGMQPDPRTFQHAALDVFASVSDGALSQVRFPKWWRTSPRSTQSATVLGRYVNGDPFLLERTYKKGRVILCTAPPDRRWNSTFPSAWEFPVLVNEMVQYLASAEADIGSSLDELLRTNKRLTILTPEFDERMVEWPKKVDTGAIGVYRVKSKGSEWPFVVHPDLAESDLTRCSEDDWRAIRARLPIPIDIGDAESRSLVGDGERRVELWWLFLIVVLLLLCSEVWMTRRMAMSRGLS